MALNIEISEQGDINIVTLKDKLDVNACLELKEKIGKKISDTDRWWHFNLQKVESLISEGLGTFLSLKNDIEDIGGRLTFCVSKKIADKLKVTQLDTIFEIFETNEKALASYQ